MKISYAILVTSLALTMACSDSGDPKPKANTANFTTYNVGLARGFVPKAAERLQPIAAALADLDTDVVCLQEVWLIQDEQGEWVTDQIDDIVEAMTPAYPHNFYEVTRAEGNVGCTEEEAAPLEACTQAKCAGIDPGDLTQCVLDNCSPEFGAVSKPCSQCLIGELGAPIEDIIAACVGEGGGNSGFAYDGHNGLMIFSRHPLSNTKHTAFPAVQTARSVLEADVAIPNFGDVRVMCTHLTSDLSSLAEYPAELSDFETYEEEHAFQIDTLIQMVADSKLPAVVLGDMNTGPEGDTYSSELLTNYTKLIDAGWKSPIVDSPNRDCTYCQVNTLTTESGSNTPNKSLDLLIDHVFETPGQDFEATSAKRIYTEPQMIDGEELHLSDHFGLVVEFSK